MRLHAPYLSDTKALWHFFDDMQLGDQVELTFGHARSFQKHFARWRADKPERDRQFLAIIYTDMKSRRRLFELRSEV